VAGWHGWTDEQRQIFWEEAGSTLREYCRVPPEELDALRPTGAWPRSDRASAPDAVGRQPIALPSATHSWQQQLRAVEGHLREVQAYVRTLEQQVREQTLRAEELSAALHEHKATVGERRTARADEAVRTRPRGDELARLASSRPARLFRWAGRMRWRAAGTGPT
jgi:hypothetical protein